MRSPTKPLLGAALPLLLAGLAGCADSPSGGLAAPHTAAWLSSPDLAVVHATLADVSGRILYSMTDKTGREEFGASIGALNTSIEAGDVDGAARSLALARGELARAGDQLSAPDRASVAATLDRVADLISQTLPASH